MDIEQLLKREQLVKQICAQLNNFVDLKNILISIISQVKELTGFEAVSIRLNENGDFPYYVYNGFPDSFVKKENSLCTCSTGVPPNSVDKLPLDCLCGNVIRGKTDKTKNYYTAKGSYYTNGSTITGAELIKDKAAVNIRNFCNACGYESIGLFPVKAREENLGLIQLNDKRTNMFTDDLIEFLEMIGEQIGVAIENAQLYEKLKLKNIELQQTVDDLKNAHGFLLESKKMMALADLVTGLNHEILQPVNDSIMLVDKLNSDTKEFRSKEAGNTNDLDSLLITEKSIQANLNTVKNLLKSFRSIAFDQFQETRHLINLRTFLNDIVRVIKPSLKNKDIGFVIDCNENSEIMTFTGAISQVLIILIQNSISHAFASKSSGIIKLASKIGSDDVFEISVTDNGCGINENIRHKIFEPFFTTDKKKHSGLGLYIASNLVESKLKGKLVFEPALAHGSTFKIKIPV